MDRTFMIVIAVMVALPLVLSGIFWIIFRYKGSKIHANGFSLTLMLLALVPISFIFYLSFHSKRPDDYERDRIKDAVNAWVLSNALYPLSYKVLDYYGYTEIIKPKDRDSKLMDTLQIPIGLYYRSTGADSQLVSTLKYAYYFIENKHLLKNKNGNIDTVDAYFQLSPKLQVLNVRIKAENEAERIMPTRTVWREKYGNDKKNLELEIHGQTDETYWYNNVSGGGFLLSVVPYSNNSVNGTVYGFDLFGDTSTVQNYKNGIRNGTTEEICHNGRILFKGELINGKFTGLSTWWHCETGKKSEEGIRVNDIEVGKWKYWDKNGKLIKIVENLDRQLLDSVQDILPDSVKAINQQ